MTGGIYILRIGSKYVAWMVSKHVFILIWGVCIYVLDL